MANLEAIVEKHAKIGQKELANEIADVKISIERIETTLARALGAASISAAGVSKRPARGVVRKPATALGGAEGGVVSELKVINNLSYFKHMFKTDEKFRAKYHDMYFPQLQEKELADVRKAVGEKQITTESAKLWKYIPANERKILKNEFEVWQATFNKEKQTQHLLEPEDDDNEERVPDSDDVDEM